MKKIILASASPRRVELLNKLGLRFMQKVSSVSEDEAENLPPIRLVEKLALDKAKDVARRIDGGVVIGADTAVVFEDRILGKPADFCEAVEMLKMLSGNTHEVISGIALVDAETGKYLVEHELTEVSFRDLTVEEIENYVRTGEPMDKAGAYGIQGIGAILVRGIRGCYNNVVGLPLTKLVEMLGRFGVDIWETIG